jgi:hypothetical protein
MKKNKAKRGLYYLRFYSFFNKPENFEQMKEKNIKKFLQDQRNSDSSMSSLVSSHHLDNFNL